MNPTEEELERIVNSKKCKSVKIDGKVKDEVKAKSKEGGFAFLAAIPAIIGVLAGTAGIATRIASTVAKSREAIKTQKEIEALAEAKK